MGQLEFTVNVLELLALGDPFPDLHTLGFGHIQGQLLPGIQALLDSTSLPKLTVVIASFDERLLGPVSEALAARPAIPWFGGVVWDGGDGTRYCDSRFGAYLPHHLDDVPVPY